MGHFDLRSAHFFIMKARIRVADLDSLQARLAIGTRHTPDFRKNQDSGRKLLTPLEGVLGARQPNTDIVVPVVRVIVVANRGTKINICRGSLPSSTGRSLPALTVPGTAAKRPCPNDRPPFGGMDFPPLSTSPYKGEKLFFNLKIFNEEKRSRQFVPNCRDRGQKYQV